MIVREKILIILILFSFLGCVKDQYILDKPDTSSRSKFAHNASNNNVLGSWVVISYEDIENSSIIYKNEVESMGGMDVEIKFMDDSTFCGFNTTNEIAGHYIQKDSLINIDVYGGSKVGQPEWGNMFSDIVYSQSIESFKRGSGQLKLFYNHHKSFVTLYPKRSEIVCNWTYSKN
jgi:hypothetical protein